MSAVSEARGGPASDAAAPARPAPAGAAPPQPAPPVPAQPANAGITRTPDWRDWVGVLSMVVGMFLAIMDIQIVTSSLTQIQGGLAASPDEISWIQTSYLIAEVVMIPLSGTLSRLLSTRVLFVVSAIGFTVTSVLCAFATSLPAMIVFRTLQGFIGGAMVPTVFPVVYTIFPPKQLARIMVLISLILNLSSTLGPTLGGYLTDTLSWHWLFLVNVPFGLVIAVTVWCLIDVDKPDRSLLRYFDLPGLLLMSISLGTLTYALEEGPRWDWFADDTILAAAAVCVAAGGLFFWRVLTYRQPIVDLRAFANRNFSLGTFYTFVIGTGLFGTTYVLPLFLAQVRGFSAWQIGMTVVVTGLTQMLISPIAAPLSRKLDLRVMLAIGMALFIAAMYLTATLTSQSGFAELLVPQALRGVALMFCFLPANLIALGTLPREMLKNAAGLYNLVRNLGGAITIATVGTVMNWRFDFHWNRLIENINPARSAVQHFLEAQTGRLDGLVAGDPGLAATRLLARLVHREALVLTFNDVILLLGSMFVVGLVLMPFVRKPRSATAH